MAESERKLVTTLESQLARYAAIESAPEHKVWSLFGCIRVDTWRDVETGSIVACIRENLTQGKTEENAIKSAESILKLHAKWILERGVQGG